MVTTAFCRMCIDMLMNSFKNVTVMVRAIGKDSNNVSIAVSLNELHNTLHFY